MVEGCAQPCSDGITATYGTITCTWRVDMELFLDYEEGSGTSDVYELTLDLTIEFP